jgi:tetratricopeptide (TPR) repeat protein/predicted Ser/Thr protein kinase
LVQTKSIRDQRVTPKKIIAGKYKLIRELGRGGMGVVYKAEDVKLKRSVALKFLPQDLTRDPEARERFIHEAQAASQLEHSNICNVHEIDDDEGQMYIAMACYQGESLKEKIKRGSVSLAEAVDIALQTATGLAKAHEQGIVHRDVKPANILITEEGSVKIVDFGLAKLSSQTQITRSGTTMGTIAYMSPEQAKGDVVDQRTDVWSLGAVLYEMLAGEIPFRGDKETAVVYSILNEEPKPLHAVIPNIPYELEEIIRRALKKEPSDRFVSAKEMAAALRTVQLEMTSGVALDSVRQRKRRSLKYLFVGAAAGIIAIVGVWFVLSSIKPGLAFAERDKLLVVDVDNQTGDEVFDLALRTAIEADLDQSPYVSIFDKGQVAETLRLMKADPSSKVDEALGMDICRFAGVRALILPRILSAGQAYELQAILVDPKRNRHVDRIRVTARGREEVLLEAIDELARELRTRLGESLPSIEEADKPIIQATTSSWEALNYLSMGQAKWHEGKFKEAATFFQLALDKDPKFVSARGSLGLVQIQFLRQKEKGKEMLQQALVDAKGLPQKEYLMIKAVNLQYVDEDLDAALDQYRMIREIYPDNMIAYNNPALILRNRGQHDEAAAMFERAAEIGPRQSLPLMNLWYTHIFWRKDPLSAETAAQRMIVLAPEIANHHHCLGYALIARGEFDEAIQAYQKALSIEARHA